MENKKITYIVFKDYDENSGKQEGIVFFSDGTYKKIKNDRNSLIKYLIQYAKQENIERKSDLFYNNNRIIHLDSKSDEKELINKLIEESKTDSIIDGLGEKIEEETRKQIKEKDITRIKKEEDDIENDIEEQIKKDKENTLFARFKKKSKKFKVTVAALGLSAVLALGSGGYNLVKHLIDKKQNSNEDNEDSKNEFQDMSYEELLNSNKTSSTQKTEMTKVGQLLDYFNGRFANSHIENDKDIKAALTWDETMALNLAYNNYTSKQIEEIFNGCGEASNLLEISNFNDAYKQALIQLTKAYVLEDKEAAIGLDNLINEPTGKAFYTKYHNLFMRCKNSTGQDQINNVNNFYKELIKDYGIDKDSSDNKENIESYKLSIIPMISASEILFQNLEIDNTMSDQVISYFNDLNLCNSVSEKFNQYESIVTISETSKYHLYYNLFKEQKIEELNAQNIYYRSETLRDLSKLTLFNNIISSYNSITPNQNQEAYLDNTIQDTSYTKSETSKTVDRTTAVTEVGEDKVKEAEEKVNSMINAENEIEKSTQEQAAEEKRQELQKQEDSNKEQLENEVSKENKELEDKINDINEDISNNKDIKEKDFGQTDDGEDKIDINDEYIDIDGNIDDSIKDITTDINQNIDNPLPTPTDDGAEEGYGEININSNQIITEEIELTDEEIANMIIESMANQEQTSTSENVKTYTYTK